jgi:hypothetical protein
MRRSVATFGIVCGAVLALTAQESALEPLLKRAAEYTKQYETRFAVIIADEQYEQHAYGPSYTGPRGRSIGSEMMFLWLTGERSWLSVRNVVSVNGDAIKNSQKRLDRLLSAETPVGIPHLRQLRNEGARYNIGTIRRNFNDPMFPLQILESEAQPRFTFAAAGTETVGGASASKVAFEEHETPTFVQDGNRNLPSRGTFWIGDDGRVLRTRFDVNDPIRGLAALVIVDYRPDAKLDMLVPVTMRERYVASGPTEQIECTASYSHFRQFETGARVIP